MRPTRAEIHLDNFLHNLRYVRERIGPKPTIMAIVKANAYGHGLEIIAKAALHHGDVHAFGVATEEEGCKLRKLTSLPILVLTGALEDEVEIFLQNKLDFTLSKISLLEAIANRSRALGVKARVHVKIDTGMRRIGIEPEHALTFIRKVVELNDDIEFAGLSTHFATSDSLDPTFFNLQLSKFQRVIETLKDHGIKLPTVHAANSGAILQRPKDSAFDMVRPGIMLYGYAPSGELDEIYKHDLKPPLELLSHVVLSKRINKGEGVSYGLKWTAPRDTTIATVPVGYGDGYSRMLTNRANAIIKNKTYPIVGTICMDQIMIDVGDEEIQDGEEVRFICSDSFKLNAWTLAKTMGTIPYEVLTNISARVPRVVVTGAYAGKGNGVSFSI